MLLVDDFEIWKAKKLEENLQCDNKRTDIYFVYVKLNWIHNFCMRLEKACIFTHANICILASTRVSHL